MEKSQKFLNTIFKAQNVSGEAKPSLVFKANLPHWQPLAATFFVTFRLYGSIPNAILKDLIRQKEILLSVAGNNEEEKYNAHKRFFKLTDDYLDSNLNGPYWLSEKEILAIVKEGLHHREGKLYNLHAYCIMSNHVHLLINTLEDNTDYLYKIIQDFKKFTGREANIVLNRTGNSFWESEYYDHIVRDATEFFNILYYIYNNPVKANLVKSGKDWSGTYISDAFVVRSIAD